MGRWLLHDVCGRLTGTGSLAAGLDAAQVRCGSDTAQCCARPLRPSHTGRVGEWCTPCRRRCCDWVHAARPITSALRPVPFKLAGRRGQPVSRHASGACTSTPKPTAPLHPCAQERHAEEDGTGGRAAALGRTNSRGSGLNGGAEVREGSVRGVRCRGLLRCMRAEAAALLPPLPPASAAPGAALQAVSHATPAPGSISPAYQAPTCTLPSCLPCLQRPGRTRSRPVLLDAGDGPLAAAPIEFFAAAFGGPVEPLPAAMPAAQPPALPVALPMDVDAAGCVAGCRLRVGSGRREESREGGQ